MADINGKSKCNYVLKDDGLYMTVKMNQGMDIIEFAKWVVQKSANQEDVQMTFTVRSEELTDIIRDLAVEGILENRRKFPDAEDVLRKVMEK